MLLCRTGEIHPRTITKYSEIPLQRPLLELSKSGPISGVVLILNIEYGKYHKMGNTLFHTLFGLNYAFYAVVS